MHDAQVSCHSKPEIYNIILLRYIFVSRHCDKKIKMEFYDAEIIIFLSKDFTFKSVSVLYRVNMTMKMLIHLILVVNFCMIRLNCFCRKFLINL